MILEFLPHRACDSILPTLMSVSLPGYSACYAPSLPCAMWIRLMLKHSETLMSAMQTQLFVTHAMC